MRRPDQHNEIEINLLVEGSITYLIGGHRETLHAGELSLFWAAIPHQVIEVKDCKPYFVATLPMVLFLQFGLPEKFTHPILHASILRDEHDPADQQLLSRWTADLSKPSAEQRQIVLLEIEARLRRMAMTIPPTPVQRVRRGSGGMSSKVEEMACFVAKSYSKPININDVAASVDLHPNYAMNLFKSMFGTTLNQYITEHRIWHAQRLLATSDLPILEVAMESGFGSISRFNDVFHKSCNCSPREFRKAHRSIDRA